MDAKIQEATKAKVIGQVVSESEKAVQVDCEIDTHTGRRSWKVWFPKSRIEVSEDSVIIDRSNAWLLDSKDKEIQDRIGSWAEIQVVMF